MMENNAAANVELTSAELAELPRELPTHAAGDRYPSQAMAMLDR